MTAPAAFIAEAPLRQARRYAAHDIAGKATPGELRWLHDRPVLWLRALIEAELDVNTQTEKSRNRIAALKPGAGEPPSAEYLAAKAELETRNASRTNFKRRVEARKSEVVTIIGTDRPVIAGDLVHVLLRLAALIDDDEVTSARDYALYWAEKLGRGATPP